MHGLSLTREGLQLIAGDKLRAIVFALSKNRIIALFSGIFVTLILQSASAATVMVAGFASNSLMSLTQAMAVLLGAAIGTTITVQLISFHLPAYALAVVAVGMMIQLLMRKRRNRYIGQTILGFGLLFLGMKLMEDATIPLRSSEDFHYLLERMSHNQLEGLLLGILLTVIMQGTAPMVGLLIALASSNTLSLSLAMPLLLGANIGATITPIFLTSTKGSAEGRRVAIAHAVFKICGVIIVYPLIPYFLNYVQWIDARPNRAIANAHSIFNILNALLFLPLLGVTANLIRKHYVPSTEKNRFGPKYLDPDSIETPALAFGNAQREFLRMADMVNDIVKDVLPAMGKNDLDMIADLEERDDKIDILNREIRFYLAKISLEAVNRQQADRQVELISLSNDIENVADLVIRDILPLARKKFSGGYQFSPQGWIEIQDFHAKVCENFNLALVAYSSQNEEIARKVLRHCTHLLTIETHLKEKHIGRLNQGTRESIETSSMHLDLLAQLRQINGYIGNLAFAVVRYFEAEKQRLGQ